MGNENKPVLHGGSVLFGSTPGRSAADPVTCGGVPRVYAGGVYRGCVYGVVYRCGVKGSVLSHGKG